MEDSALVTIVALICLTIVEVAALMNGIDSVILGLIVAALSGLGGYKLKGYLGLKDTTKEGNTNVT